MYALPCTSLAFPLKLFFYLEERFSGRISQNMSFQIFRNLACVFRAGFVYVIKEIFPFKLILWMCASFTGDILWKIRNLVLC